MKTNNIGWSNNSKNFTQRYLKAEKKDFSNSI